MSEIKRAFFLFYRKFWLLSGNSKHCGHDANPEYLCGPLTPEVSGRECSLLPKPFLPESFALGFACWKALGAAHDRAVQRESVRSQCLPDIVPHSAVSS